MWTCRHPTQSPRRRRYHDDQDDAFLSGFARIAGGGRGAWKRPEVPKKLVLAPKYFPSLPHGQRVRLY